MVAVSLLMQEMFCGILWIGGVIAMGSGSSGAGTALKQYNAAINSQVESVSIPTLSGSDKQKKWASDIMQGIMDDIDASHAKLNEKSQLQQQVEIAQRLGKSPKTEFGDTLVGRINDDRNGALFLKKSFAEFCRGVSAGTVINLRYDFKDMLNKMYAKARFVSAYKKKGDSLTLQDGAKAIGNLLRQMGVNW